jgi:hypothetical protein
VLARQVLYPYATPLVLFALVIFQIASQVCAQASLDNDPPIYASW